MTLDLAAHLDRSFTLACRKFPWLAEEPEPAAPPDEQAVPPEIVATEPAATLLTFVNVGDQNSAPKRRPSLLSKVMVGDRIPAGGMPTNTYIAGPDPETPFIQPGEPRIVFKQLSFW